MIGSIKGTIVFRTDKSLIAETNGVGYKINVSPDTLQKTQGKSDTVSFWIYTHVREDALDLFGFLEHEELEFFEMLIGVSGIGPRSALAILGIASLDTLRQAISTGDTAYLTKISGIGKKTAERIVIDLRDKMSDRATSTTQGTSLKDELDALEALKSLGYGQNDARDALKQVSADSSTNIKIKEALKILGSK